MTTGSQRPPTVTGGLIVLTTELLGRGVVATSVLLVAVFLEPAEFGLAAVAHVAYAAALAFLNPGLDAAAHAISHREELDRSLLGLALVSGAVGSIAVGFGSGVLAKLFGQPDAQNLIVLVSVAIVLRRYAETRRAMIERAWAFRTSSLLTLMATVAGALTAVVAAWAGLGSRALILQVLATDLVFALLALLVRIGPRRPSFKVAPLRPASRFARETLLGNSLVFAYTNLDDVAVSRLLGAGALGGYNFAYRITSLPAYTLAHTLGRVLLPSYRWYRVQGQNPAGLFATALRLAIAVATLVLGGLLIHGPALLEEVYDGRWSDFYAPFRVLCAYGLVRTIGGVSGSTLLAMDRPDQLRRIGVWQTLALLVVLGPATAAFGVVGTATAATIPMGVGVIVACALSSDSVGHGRWATLLEATRGIVVGGLGWIVTLPLVWAPHTGPLATASLSLIMASLVVGVLLREDLKRVRADLVRTRDHR